MNDASKFWQAVRDYNKEKEWYTMEVVKLDNRVRMKVRELEIRISAIEQKQAKRFPHLIERLEKLENKQNAEIYNDGAFESDYPNW